MRLRVIWSVRFVPESDEMQPAITDEVVILLCLAGAFAARSARGSRTGGGTRPRSSWGQVVAVSSAALSLAVVVVTVYLRR